MQALKYKENKHQNNNNNNNNNNNTKEQINKQHKIKQMQKTQHA